ncbi:polynucleotide adenylyltransferase [Halomonas sp. ML-15]|uniref:polynucleotide adenylyltransferase n=1 Tax=Halomonas sp. ML-15 TaxID=2773305 RepID=UPI0017461942|nr:polynucleotide adenylyltransferase [Halomonas sp. ML-15]MBD3894853.1 polynucleotide adenylyltransferase [Halomonas sp. ML-15]
MTDTADRCTAGLEVYRVGGAVRDARLGWPVYDNDWVVVGATPEQMTARGFKPVGRDFPVFLHPQSHEEYALARTERKAGHGYTGFVVHASPEVTLEEDLARRDLTINAMAEAADGRLVDPYHGSDDLAAGILRHVSSAFAEDPLRVLRTARFLARYQGLGFRIADATQALMAELAASGEMAHLVAERVWTETEKALVEPHPAAYFESLDDCGALAQLMPELREEAGDALEAALARLDRVPEEPLDDLAGSLPRWRWARLVEHLGDAEREALSKRLRLPNAYADLARQVALSRALWRQEHPDAAAILGWLDAIDAWRRSARVVPLISLVSLERPALAADLALAWRLAQQVVPRLLLEEGYRGKALGEEVHRRRYQVIADALL